MSPGPNPNFFNTFNCYPYHQQRALPAARGTNTPLLSEYGSALTPRGDLRVLVVYAGFTNDNDQNYPAINNNNSLASNPWPQELNGSAYGEALPRSAASQFYTSMASFSSSATDQSLSNFYYQMSQFGSSPFRMMAVNFPVRVNVTATTAINQNGFPWGTYSQMVLDRIRTEPALQAHMTSLSRSQLDARTNGPEFAYDNSITGPDNAIDYTIIVWRYDGTNPGVNGSNAGRTQYLDYAVGSGGGYASVPGGTVLVPASGSTPALTVREGYTQCQGMSGIDQTLFVHEFAHTLYWAPHTNGANGVLGKYFQGTLGHGMVSNGIHGINFNGWERWYLGWSNLTCNGQSGNLAPASGTTQHWVRDFITTGDVLRVQLPNTYNPDTKTYQYLWLENRQKKSIWDQLQWLTNGQTPPQALPTVPAGLEAYVEDMGQNKDNPLGAQGFWSGVGANGFKYPATGNADLRWNGGQPNDFNNHLWGNLIYPMTGWAEANPFSGSHDYGFVRADRDQNGVIGYQPDANSGNRQNESYLYLSRQGTPTNGLLGHTLRFNAPARVGLDTNPGLANHTYFNAATQQLAPYQLSGVSVRLIDRRATDGAILVEVRYEDTDLTQSTRWAGNLYLNPSSNPASGYDLRVLAGATLRVDRSGTPNRSTPGPGGDFINNTYLHVADGVTALIAESGKLQVGKRSTVYVADNAKLLADPGAVVEVEEDGLLSVYDNDAADALQQYGQLVLHSGGKLEIRSTGVVISGRPAAQFDVYPNPATSQQVQFALRGAPTREAGQYRYRLLTPQGLPVRGGTCPAAGASTLTGVPAGVYLLELRGPQGQRETHRVLVNP